MEVRLRLPIPSDKLAANARCHWAVKQAITKQHRTLAKLEAFQQLDRVSVKSYKLVFFWPNKIRRDKRNASERCKAYEDGLSDYLQEDDSLWDFCGVDFEIDKENPRLEFLITTKEDADR